MKTKNTISVDLIRFQSKCYDSSNTSRPEIRRIRLFNIGNFHTFHSQQHALRQDFNRGLIALYCRLHFMETFWGLRNIYLRHSWNITLSFVHLKRRKIKAYKNQFTILAITNRNMRSWKKKKKNVGKRLSCNTPVSCSCHFEFEMRLDRHQNCQDGKWSLLRTSL